MAISKKHENVSCFLIESANNGLIKKCGDGKKSDQTTRCWKILKIKLLFFIKVKSNKNEKYFCISSLPAVGW